MYQILTTLRPQVSILSKLSYSPLSLIATRSHPLLTCPHSLFIMKSFEVPTTFFFFFFKTIVSLPSSLNSVLWINVYVIFACAKCSACAKKEKEKKSHQIFRKYLLGAQFSTRNNRNTKNIFV